MYQQGGAPYATKEASYFIQKIDGDMASLHKQGIKLPMCWWG